MKNSTYVCTNCGTDLQYYDFVWRTVKNAGGKIPMPEMSQNTT